MTTLNAPWLHGPARGVCTMLEDAGYQAWFVGGVVRNALIDAPVSDLDLSTDALPETVMSLAKAAGLKAIPTGIDHGTVTIVSNGEPVEVTTFRRDVATDGRHAGRRWHLGHHRQREALRPRLPSGRRRRGGRGDAHRRRRGGRRSVRPSPA